MSEPVEKDVKTESSMERPRQIYVKEPEYEPKNSVRLPVIRKSTHIGDIMNHDIYKQNDDKKLNSHHSVQSLTFRQNGIGSSMSKESKQSSLHSHSKSNASIFQERYDKNIEQYMNSLENRYNNRKNMSSNLNQLMSPHYTSTKRRDYEL